MKKYFFWFGVLFFLAMQFGIGLCPSIAQEKGKPEEPYIIGYICNESWPIAAEAYYATLLAADEINKSGGILGRPVKIIKADSKGQAPMAVAGYKKLVMNNKASVVIVADTADINSACQEEGAALYKEYPHLTFNPTTAPDFLWQKLVKDYAKYKFYFITFAKGDYHRYWNPSLGRTMKKLNNIKKVAILVEDAAWTENMRNGVPGKYTPIKEAMEKEAGLEVVYYAVTSSREKMFIPLFQAMASKNPDWILFISAYSDVATFCKQWAMSPVKDVDFHVSGGAGQMAKFWEISGGAALGMSTPVYSEASLSEKTLPFVDNLKKQYKKDSNWNALGSYDSIYIVKAAAEKAKTTNPETLIKTLENIEYTGVYGIIKYDKTHTCKTGWPYMDFPVGQTQLKGDMVIWWPEEVAKATNPNKPFIPVKKMRQLQGK